MKGVPTKLLVEEYVEGTVRNVVMKVVRTKLLVEEYEESTVRNVV